jgi:hypothetical protein
VPLHKLHEEKRQDNLPKAEAGSIEWLSRTISMAGRPREERGYRYEIALRILYCNARVISIHHRILRLKFWIAVFKGP